MGNWVQIIPQRQLGSFERTEFKRRAASRELLRVQLQTTICVKNSLQISLVFSSFQAIPNAFAAPIRTQIPIAQVHKSRLLHSPCRTRSRVRGRRSHRAVCLFKRLPDFNAQSTCISALVNLVPRAYSGLVPYPPPNPKKPWVRGCALVCRLT